MIRAAHHPQGELAMQENETTRAMNQKQILAVLR